MVLVTEECEYPTDLAEMAEADYVIRVRRSRDSEINNLGDIIMPGSCWEEHPTRNMVRM